MAAKLSSSPKVVQPENVLRSIFVAGLLEMQRADVEIRIGNTDKYGGGLVLSVPAWRYCGCCEGVVTVPEYDNAMARCRKCAGADVPVLAQGQVSEVPA